MSSDHLLLLAGGVGGSRIAHGLANLIEPPSLKIAVNTADDFRHLGLSISPDLDTITYMLAGLVNEAQGWGRRDESWHAMELLEILHGPTWFNLGDRDIGLHLYRTHALEHGQTLSEITKSITFALGIDHHVFPMCDDHVATTLLTDEGNLDFQSYFVEKQCAPSVSEVRYSGIEQAEPSPYLTDALISKNLKGIIIAPSNPLLSIGPILALNGVRDAIAALDIPVIAISPLINGKAVKGPAAKIMRELAMEPNARGIANFYDGVADILLVAQEDAGVTHPNMKIISGDIMMPDAAGRIRLARLCLDVLEEARRAQ